MSRRRPLETIREADLITIGELGRISGARYSTLKFYVEEGMLPFAQEDAGLTRRFERVSALARLNEINALKAEGLSITEIKRRLPGNF